MQRSSISIIAMLIGVASSLTAHADELMVGQTLESAIRSIEQDGYKLFYSSDLVRPWMQIETELTTGDALTRLGEALGHHGLMLRRGLNDSWLVVRAPRERKTETDPVLAASVAPTPVIQDTRPVEEIIVAASQYEIRRAQTVPAAEIRKLELESLPDLGDDALRAVARLPGMASTGWSALSNIRGGEIGETLVRLDGLRLYDPFHLKDFKSVFSAIDPRIVESMNVYTGGFSAAYGDRMSGVIDVETIPASGTLYHELGFSFFNASFLSSGSFDDSRGRWIASVRRSNLDLLYRNFSDQPERPRYLDVFAKVGFELGEHLKLTGNVLRVQDDISLSDDVDREEHALAKQLDSYIWLKLDHEIDGATSGSTLIARSTLENRRAGTSAKSGVSEGWLSDVRDVTIESVQTQWSRVIGARMLAEFGGLASRFRGSYAYQDSVEFDLLFLTPGAPSERERSRSISVNPDGRQLSLFGSLRFDWTEALTTEFGARWDTQRVGDQRDTTVGPRLGLRYSVSDRTAIRASWGRFFQSQSINELQVNDGVADFQPPQRADQRVIGLDRLIGDHIQLRIEAYEKDLRDLRPRFENLLNTRVLLPELKPDRIRIAPRSAIARGTEIAVDGAAGDFRWWGALTMARVRDRVDGTEIPRSWDQTHALSAGFSWRSSKWTLSSGLLYRTGWPRSTVTLDESAAEPAAIVLGINDKRMRPFGSLDLRAVRLFAFEDTDLSVSFELTNMTDRANPCCFEYEIGDEEDAGEFVLDEKNYLPRIPSIGILWQF